MTKEKLVWFLNKKCEELTVQIKCHIEEKNSSYHFAYKLACINIYKVIFLKSVNQSNIIHFLKNYTLEEIFNNYFRYVLDYKFINILEEKKFIDLYKKDFFTDFISDICISISHLDREKMLEFNALGDMYEALLGESQRKNLGVFYTPQNIITYIIDSIDEQKILFNPFTKILDISCGSGHFLVKIYDKLYNLFRDNISFLREKYKNDLFYIESEEIKGIDYWIVDNINYHIMKNCIYGCDIDKFAVQNTIINLAIISIGQKQPKRFNIQNGNSLDTKFLNDKFDYILGNPPYVGNKSLSKTYKDWILKEYSDVFKNKSDIYNCFYKRINELLNKDGIGSVITPRYFIESPSGKNLRKYLSQKTYIIEVIDFYKACVFKNLGIANCIFTFQNKDEFNKNINIFRYNKEKYDLKENINLKDELFSESFEHFFINQENLNEQRWVFAGNRKLEIFNSINKASLYKLSDICESFQGIITGCDKAFVVNNEDVNTYNIEKSLIKTWIKNRNINKYEVEKTSLNLIYSDIIEDENQYKNTIDYIRKYKEKLEKRRECKNGVRKWYKLQWGRNINLFEKSKIVFPYKSKQNKFAIDYNKSFFSADVYSLYIKDEYIHDFSLEYITAILNSKIYEFYFKIFAKQMGKGIYDYYPNSVMELKIFKNEYYEDIVKLFKKLIILNKEKDLEKIQKIEYLIDEFIAVSLDINKDDINFIYENI